MDMKGIVLRLGSGGKANYPHVGPWPAGCVPSVGVFLKYPSRIKVSFGKKQGKFRTASRQARPRIEPGTSRLPVLRQNRLATDGCGLY